MNSEAFMASQCALKLTNYERSRKQRRVASVIDRKNVVFPVVFACSGHTLDERCADHQELLTLERDTRRRC